MCNSFIFFPIAADFGQIFLWPERSAPGLDGCLQPTPSHRYEVYDTAMGICYLHSFHSIKQQTSVIWWTQSIQLKARTFTRNWKNYHSVNLTDLFFRINIYYWFFLYIPWVAPVMFSASVYGAIVTLGLAFWWPCGSSSMSKTLTPHL